MKRNITKPKQLPQVDDLRKSLDYDPLTGIFTWKLPRRGRGVRVGGVVGTVRKNGYVQIGFGAGGLFQAHRLAWLYVTGNPPTCQIDHIDGDPGNNRFSNLRESTQSQNLMNTKMKRHNTSGVKGVAWDKTRQKWVAKAAAGGVVISARFVSIGDADEAARAARLRLHGEFSNHGGSL